MINRGTFIAIATFGIMTIAPSFASAQSWTFNNPSAGGNYHTSQVDIDVTYDWSASGPAAQYVLVELKNPTTGNNYTISRNLIGTTLSTSYRSAGTIAVSQVCPPGTPAEVVFTAMGPNGAVSSPQSIYITIWTHP